MMYLTASSTTSGCSSVNEFQARCTATKVKTHSVDGEEPADQIRNLLESYTHAR